MTEGLFPLLIGGGALTLVGTVVGYIATRSKNKIDVAKVGTDILIGVIQELRAQHDECKRMHEECEQASLVQQKQIDKLKGDVRELLKRTPLLAEEEDAAE